MRQAARPALSQRQSRPAKAPMPPAKPPIPTFGSLPPRSPDRRSFRSGRCRRFRTTASVAMRMSPAARWDAGINPSSPSNARPSAGESRRSKNESRSRKPDKTIGGSIDQVQPKSKARSDSLNEWGRYPFFVKSEQVGKSQAELPAQLHHDAFPGVANCCHCAAGRSAQATLLRGATNGRSALD